MRGALRRRVQVCSSAGVRGWSRPAGARDCTVSWHPRGSRGARPGLAVGRAVCLVLALLLSEHLRLGPKMARLLCRVLSPCRGSVGRPWLLCLRPDLAQPRSALLERLGRRARPGIARPGLGRAARWALSGHVGKSRPCLRPKDRPLRLSLTRTGTRTHGPARGGAGAGRKAASAPAPGLQTRTSDQRQSFLS